MTEFEIRQHLLSVATDYYGCSEHDGSHKQIIDLYNTHKPLARGYKVKYTDAWCATFVSAIAIQCGLTDIIPTECSCQKQIELFKKLGRWVEDDSYVPKPGDILYYDWDDDGKGDTTGWSDHVGYVYSVKNNKITVLEGNRNNRVKYCTIAVNARYIRGYGIPNYASKATKAEQLESAENIEVKEEKITVEVKVLKKGMKGGNVYALQALLIGYGYSCGSSGVDGSFGSATDKAVRAYQKAKGLTVDGSVGPATWKKLLGNK